ncbi:DUF2931 family protein [Halopseudomonas aestusnigri]|uniref:DUF2931 family protein n=1 Tax=Halopseudomonas aestusnigri TaxID=857252 RepID=UPI002555CAAF|nr:DUF2931 family protein [Halopseudomonas aestusnigri]MDL2200243.1 DUF2931 family protein [Halopseudomonas aestusnigri]
MIWRSTLAILLASLAACSQQSASEYMPAPANLPFERWYIGLFAPDYMEVWVEQIDVTDRQGFTYYNVHGGVAAINTPPDNRGDPSGWPERVGTGKTMPMINIDLPTEVSVKWQSLAEPEAYEVTLAIPQWVNDEMLKPKSAYCRWRDAHVVQHRDIISIGLAPGGVAKAWLIGPCLPAMEVARAQGKVRELGPYNGKSNGEFYRPPSPNAQHYIDTHGIPFGSW